MRLHPPLAAAAVSVLCALAGTTVAPASAASFKTCAGSYAPDGTPGGGFYAQIRAKRVSCPTAKRVTRAWILKEADGSRNPTAAIRIAGYSCKGRPKALAPHDREGGLAVLCVRGARVVAFYGHP
jgi:hypothetical protein